MRFIPLEYLVINTLLAPLEARARLAGAVAPRAGAGAVPLRGSVGLVTFAVRRAAPTRWATPAEFRGRIEPRGAGARLTGMVSVGVPTVLVLTVAAVAAFVAGAEPLARLLAGEPTALRRLAPLGVVILGWVLAVRGVAAEARRLRQVVNEALARPAARS